MSLDVYLTIDGAHSPEGSGIYIRENGSVREITRAEWDERFPGREPVVATGDSSGEVYSANITHNLNTMASEAGLYDALWRPDEHGYDIAAQLVEPLRAGLVRLMAEPERFQAFNPPNGWGNYEGLVSFVGEYLAACERFPTAKVHASR